MSKRATVGITCLTLLALAGCGLADAPPPPETGARAYAAWLNHCLTALEGDIPALTASAEMAAKRYVHEDYRIAAAGETYFVSEAQGRAGGLARLEAGKIVLSPDPQVKLIVLYGLREAKAEGDLAQLQQLRQLGRVVIGFGRKALLRQAVAAGAVFDAVVETHAAEEGGLFQDAAGARLIPTDPAANIAALWAWTAEFTAACLREGKMPPYYQSIMVPGGKERNATLGTMKFHETAPAPIPAGVLARAYLRAVRENFARVSTRELPQILAAADLALDAKAKGRRPYAYLWSHALAAQLPYPPHDPGYFHQINTAWTKLKPGTQLEKDDVILCLGYDALYRGEGNWGNFAENARAAGARLIWSLTDYRTEEIHAILPGEPFVNQHWAMGDAVVEIPGYDVKILPPSGVIAEAILWMIHAEMYAKSPPTK